MSHFESLSEIICFIENLGFAVKWWRICQFSLYLWAVQENGMFYTTRKKRRKVNSYVFLYVIEIRNCWLRRIDSFLSCFFLLLKIKNSFFNVFFLCVGLLLATKSVRPRAVSYTPQPPSPKWSTKYSRLYSVGHAPRSP